MMEKELLTGIQFKQVNTVITNEDFLLDLISTLPNANRIRKIYLHNLVFNSNYKRSKVIETINLEVYYNKETTPVVLGLSDKEGFINRRIQKDEVLKVIRKLNQKR